MLYDTDMGVEELIKQAHELWMEQNDASGAETLFLKAADFGTGHAFLELGVLYIVGGNGLAGYKNIQLDITFICGR